LLPPPAAPLRHAVLLVGGGALGEVAPRRPGRLLAKLTRHA